MKKYVVAVAIAIVVAAGVAASVTSDDSSPAAAQTTSVPGVIPDVATLDGDDVTDDASLGDQGEGEDAPSLNDQLELEIEEDVPASPVIDRSAVLSDLRNAIEARSKAFGEALVDLSAHRAAGDDVSLELAELIDGIEVFGESVITGVAITPDTLAAVPDLREIHQDLIDQVDDLHNAALGLDPSAGDAAWDASATEVLNALGSLASLIELAG